MNTVDDGQELLADARRVLDRDLRGAIKGDEETRVLPNVETVRSPLSKVAQPLTG